MFYMKLKPMFRAIRAEEIAVGDDDTVTFPFSSEEPVDRWFGTEILSHDQGAMNLDRVRAGAAPFLWNHDPDQPIGMILSADVKGKRGFATAKYFSTPFAQEKKKQMQEGLRNVSFGYSIDEMEKTRAAQDNKPDEYTARKYGVFEISQVSVPADFKKVGVGRSEVDEEREVKIIGEITQRDLDDKNPLRGKRNMDEKELAAKAAQAEADRVKKNEEYSRVKAEAQSEERARSAAITSLGEKFKKQDLARQLVEGGKTVDEARAAFLDAMGAKQIALTGNEAELGLSDKEKRSYSWVRAMNFLANPHDRSAREAAKFELEVSMAAADKSGKASRGLMVPIDMLRHKAGRRDLTVGSATAGGDLVATELQSASFIELLRNKSVMQRAGATVLNGLVGNIAIPKATGASTAYWVAESGAPTEGAQTVGQVSMSPKTVGAYTDYSRKLLLQSSIDVENFVRGDLAAIIALEIDRVALYGSGSSNQPQGVKPAIAGNSNEVNFAADVPTFAEVISMESAITAANADLNAMKYILNASLQGSLKGAVKESGFPVYILDGGQMNGYPALMSNQIASGDLFFGSWDQLIMAFWSGLDLMVDPYSQSTSGTVRIVALQDCDIALRHKESVARGNNNP